MTKKPKQQIEGETKVTSESQSKTKKAAKKEKPENQIENKKRNSPTKKASEKQKDVNVNSETVEFTNDQLLLVDLWKNPTLEKFDLSGFPAYDNGFKGKLYQIPDQMIPSLLDTMPVYDKDFNEYEFKKSKHKASEKVFLLLPKQ